MEVKIDAGVIGAQTIVERIEKGDLIVNNSEIGALSSNERIDLISSIVDHIEAAIVEIDGEVIPDSKKEQLRIELRRVKEAVSDDEEAAGSAFNSFISGLNESLGQVSGIVSKSIQLAQFFGLR